MIDEEIVIKAIEKAHENGYDWKKKGVGVAHLGEKYYIDHIWCALETIIYSHEFAKAFWGEERVSDSWYSDWNGITCLGAYNVWQVELQRMILEKEPIKYIEKFL